MPALLGLTTTGVVVELDELLSQAVGVQGIGGEVGVEQTPPTSLPSRKPPAPYSPPPRHPSGANAGIGQVSYKHDAIIDFILQNPGVQQNEIARYFDYSVSWISQIIASDAFQVRLAERAGDLVDPLIRRDRDAMFKSLIDRSFEILQQKLQMPANVVPDQLVLRTMELASRAVGYGAREAAVVINNNQTNSVNLHLEQMGEGLKNLLRRKRIEVLEGEVDVKDET